MGQANSRRQRVQQSSNPNVPPEIILKMTQLHNEQYGGGGGFVNPYGVGAAGCEGGPIVGPGPGPFLSQPQFGPGPAAFGPGPAAFGPGPAAFGPGPAAFGPGPAAFGPGPAAFGPGPAAFGPGPAAFGPGPAVFGPGSAAFGPGPAAFGPGPAAFGPGSAAFGSFPGFAAPTLGPSQAFGGPAPTFGPSQAFNSFGSFGGSIPASGSFAQGPFNSSLPPVPPSYALTQGPNNGSAITQVAPPAPIYKHVSTVVQYSNNPNEFVGQSSASAAPLALPAPPHSTSGPAGAIPPSLPPSQSIQNKQLIGPSAQFGSNYTSGGVISSGGFLPSAPSTQLHFPSPSQYYGSLQGPNGYFGSGYSQYPASYTLNGTSGYFNNGSQAYTNNFNNGSQAYTNNFNNNSSFVQQNSTNFSQQAIDSAAAYENATANATTSNPYGHYSNNFSAAFPASTSGSGNIHGDPSLTMTTSNANGGNAQDSNALTMPTATSQTERRRAQHSSVAPPKQIVVYRPSIHKSKQRFTVVA